MVKVLTNLGVNQSKLYSAIEYTVGRGEKPRSGDIGLTARLKKVTELAIGEASQLGLDYIGPEHLLLGLLLEREGVAAMILRNFVITIDQALTEINKLLSILP